MQHKRKLVFVCLGSDCKKSGGKALRKDLKESFKHGEWKGRCKLITTKCMDMCKSGPIAIVGEHFCKHASVAKISDILKKS
ncbi:MAG: (2Fe-2S) ferredoxin domain-containing protein [Cyclobacteriaceae bacterium]|nr:(2Fe-2S) ferredoxin domain-containing protein [Cyclobacteriaceae bacterium]MDX5466887.1 (2Fe-2S) ferredoxin domain-containing protein [Cyclobacteriaceae bacterium]